MASVTKALGCCYVFVLNLAFAFFFSFSFFCFSSGGVLELLMVLNVGLSSFNEQLQRENYLEFLNVETLKIKAISNDVFTLLFITW